MADIKPPFTEETARQKVKAAQALWNTRYQSHLHLINHQPLTSPSDPTLVTAAYTESSTWRNRTTFLHGHAEIHAFLTAKWSRERNYRLRKELFSFGPERIAVQFWYEFQDGADGMVWKRCYGLEHWGFEGGGGGDGRMERRVMSGNDLVIGEGGRWFVDGVDVDEVEIDRYL